MDDLGAIWAACEHDFAWADYKALLDAGIPPKFLATRRLGAGGIKILSPGWERRIDGPRAVMLPVTMDGELVDIVAFRMEAPRSFWALTGAAPLLGQRELEAAHHFQHPLIVRRSPLEWLIGEAAGIVVLDWKHYWPTFLGGLVALQFDDRGYAARATALFQAPLPLPPSMVPSA